MTKCQESKIIVISATQNELSYIDKIAVCNSFVTGIGIVETILNVSKIIEQYKPEIIVQVGICGAVDKSFSIGEVVCVKSDFVGDIGAWRRENQQFVSFDQPIYQGVVIKSMKCVNGVTVNLACNDKIDRKNAQIESMEGASFFAVASNHGVKALQVRAVSNYINSRREEWNVNLALQNLGNAIKNLNFETCKTL